MFINKLQLKNFKRFTALTVDLTGQQDENPPKLVLLIGANGSGKSCIFDAFECLDFITVDRKERGVFFPAEKVTNNYYFKDGDIKNLSVGMSGSEGYWGGHEDLICLIEEQKTPSGIVMDYLNNPYKFYGRSAFRNIAYLNTDRHAGEFGEQKIDNVVKQNLDRTEKLIDSDQRWETDIVYACTDNIKREVLVNSINSSLNNIFSKNLIGKFQIESIKVDIGGLKSSLALEVLIRKGDSIFVYEYLSAGEKQLFTILLNLHLRKKYLENTIIYLDEIDLHLNTSIQSDLLKEITENLIPDNSQVWVASHSLGFIDYARQKTYKYDEITETEVEIKKVILDFDNLNFDEVQVLKPERRDNLKVYDIAVPQETLAVLFQDKQKIYCENKNDKYYNLLALENKIFLPETDKNAVFLRLQNNKENDAFGIIDRDYLSDPERQKLMKKFKNIKVLEYYCFENYLYHPDNINELKISDFDKQEYIKKLIEIKNRENDNIKANLSNSRNSYIFFKKNEEFKLKDENLDCIFKLLNSDELEDFYKVFSMKNKQDLANINKHKSELVRTNWFKTKINEVLQ